MRVLRPDVSVSAARLIIAMLEKDRTGRLQTPEGVIFWIDTIRTGREAPPVDLEIVGEETPPPPGRPVRFLRRPPPGRGLGPQRPGR